MFFFFQHRYFHDIHKIDGRFTMNVEINKELLGREMTLFFKTKKSSNLNRVFTRSLFFLISKHQTC